MEPEPETKLVPRGTKELAVPASELPLGRLLAGRYELIQRLGYGGMATVYLARAIGKAGFEKLVAVKVIHPHLVNEPEFVEMFLDEARIAAGIHHPHVVEILDLGDDDGTFFTVMEYVEGETLSQLIRQNRQRQEVLPLSIVLQIIADALEGLSAAHNLRDRDGSLVGLVHRDVSPQNLLVTMDGWVKVVDFGIMKAAGKRSNTLTGQLRGKLAYMAPEQAQGKAIDCRTDLFALGAVLWELCTNRRLFAADNEAATLELVVQCDVADVASLRPDIPDAVRTLLERALARDPAQRFSSADAMLTDVRTVLLAASGGGDPRRELATWMQDRFAAKVQYARAALREREPGESLRAPVLEFPGARGGNQAANEEVLTPREATPSRLRRLTTTAEYVIPAAASSVSGAVPGAAKHWTAWILLPLIGAVIGTAVATWQWPRPEAPRDSAEAARVQPIPPAPEAERVKWIFSTDPGGATVTIAGQAQPGVTPLEVEIARGDTALEVIVEKAGHAPRMVKLAPVASQNFFYDLHPKEEASPAEADEANRRNARPSTPTRSKRSRSSSSRSVAGDDARMLKELPDFTKTTTEREGTRTSSRGD